MTFSRMQLIETLTRTHSILFTLTASLPSQILDFHPEVDAWSIREILAHLVDDEMYVMRTRLERMIKEEVPSLAPHDEKKWYAQRNTNRDAIEELLSDFAIQRAASLGIITMLRENEWQYRGYQPEYGHFTVERWLAEWVQHDTVHIQQIERNIAVAQ